MKKFIVFLIFIVFLTSVEAIPELPNQFYGNVTYLNEPAPDGYKVVTKLGEEEFTTTIINGKYGVENPLLVSKDSSNIINQIDFYVNNQKILTRDYTSGEFTELNLDIPSTVVVINETTIENLNLTIGNSNNLTEDFIGIKEIEFKENNIPLIKFDYDFDAHNVKDLLKNLIIKKQEETATKGSMIIKGVELPAGKTKTVYVDNLNADSNQICILDAEITSINEISSSCNGASETLITCDGSEQNGYTCTLNGNKYEVTGLIHSGIQEHVPVCGDNICNGDETCSSCSADCGGCSTPSTGPSAGGGAGGGGSSPRGNIISPPIPVTPIGKIVNEEGIGEKITEEKTVQKGGEGLGDITGAAIGTGFIKNNSKKIIIGAVSFAVLGLLLQFNIFRKIRRVFRRRIED